MKRVLSTAVAVSLCMALTGCFGSDAAPSDENTQTNAADNAASTTSADDSKQTQDSKSESKDKSIAKTDEESKEPTIGVVDAKTGALGPVILSDPYESGIHHAWLKIQGYERIEIEIYSDDAPKTAALFCKLVRKGYYNNMQLEGLMPDLYATLGDHSGKTDGEHTVDGEFDEAGFSGNTIGLKRGVIAMSRAEQETSAKSSKNAEAAQEADSDAAHLYVFLTNASYLDGKYAGFAKITSGIATFDEICNNVKSTVKTSKKGKIKKVENCPVIKYISLED